MKENERTRAEIFETLITPHLSMMYKTAWRLTGQADRAEDLVQQTLVKIYPKTKEMRQVERLGPWLRKVLYRTFVDGLRKRSRRPEYYLSDSPDDMDTFQTGIDSPETIVERAADRQRVRQALDALNDQDRTLIIMHLLEGFTLAELRDVFQVPAETIKTRLRRARARLKNNLMK